MWRVAACAAIEGTDSSWSRMLAALVSSGQLSDMRRRREVLDTLGVQSSISQGCCETGHPGRFTMRLLQCCARPMGHARGCRDS